MGWAEHFRGRDLAWLRELGALLPAYGRLAAVWDGHERRALLELYAAADSFERVMAYSIGRLGHMLYETRQWLNSISPVQPAERLLGEKEYESLMEGYWQYWRQYLCYYI